MHSGWRSNLQNTMAACVSTQKKVGQKLGTIFSILYIADLRPKPTITNISGPKNIDRIFLIRSKREKIQISSASSISDNFPKIFCKVTPEWDDLK